MKLLCDVFNVHRSSFKYWAVRDTNIPADELVLRAEVKAAHDLSSGSAGA